MRVHNDAQGCTRMHKRAQELCGRCTRGTMVHEEGTRHAGGCTRDAQGLRVPMEDERDGGGMHNGAQGVKGGAQGFTRLREGSRWAT